MATGRRLVITSDHGYAASGMFTDVTNKEQATWLKTNFGSSRSRTWPRHGSPLVAAYFALLAEHERYQPVRARSPQMAKRGWLSDAGARRIVTARSRCPIHRNCKDVKTHG